MADTPTGSIEQYDIDSATGRLLRDDADQSYSDTEAEVITIVTVESDGSAESPDFAVPAEVTDDDELTPALITSDHAAPSPAYADASVPTASGTTASSRTPSASDGKPSFEEWISKASDGLEHGHAGFDNTNPDQSGYERLTGAGLVTDRDATLNSEDPDQTHYDPITGTSTGLGE